ncbi:MAG TPA: DUF4375 domain-containing protein [Verrucomicrobiae bacterium]
MKPQDLSLDEICQRMSNFDLCNEISRVVEERYGYDLLITWPESVPLSHRLVDFVWNTTGYLENEGFARFFNLVCNHSAYPECFDIIGLSSLAADVRKSLKLFPKGDLGNTDALISHFGSWEQIEKLADATESELYSKSDDIEAALANYIRNHKHEFESFVPEIRKQRAYIKLIGGKTD